MFASAQRNGEEPELRVHLHTRAVTVPVGTSLFSLTFPARGVLLTRFDVPSYAHLSLAFRERGGGGRRGLLLQLSEWTILKEKEREREGERGAGEGVVNIANF